MIPEECKCLSYIWADKLAPQNNREKEEIICGSGLERLYQSRQLREIAEDFTKEFEKNALLCPILCQPRSHEFKSINHKNLYRRLSERSTKHLTEDHDKGVLPFFITTEGALSAACFHRDTLQYYICVSAGQNISRIVVYYIIERDGVRNLYRTEIEL